MSTNKQRRDAARRQLEQKLQQRADRDAARKRTTLIASIVGTFVLIAAVITVVVLAGGGDSKTPAAAAGSPTAAGTTGASSATASSAGTHKPGSCNFPQSGTAERKVTPPPADVPTSGAVTVTLATNRGDLTLSMDRSKAPCTVASFASLVQQKYYDGTPCHRLTTQGIYVLQCGDPSGTGTGGPGYTIPDELTGAEKYSTGVLAMAKTSAPNSGGSQFFIVYKDTQLPPDYTVFGTVTKGLEVVDAVAAKGADGSNGAGDGKPNLPIQITSAKVVK